MDKMDTQRLIEIAKKASLEAGSAILEIYNKEDIFNIAFKDDNSPLTQADKASHEVILTHLNATNLPILSEEGKDVKYEERSLWEYYWLIDPLDGTKEFIKRNGEFTVNIALIHKGEAILGVIYAPAINKLFWGSVGNGAFVQHNEYESEAMQIQKDSIVECIVASRSHLSAETNDFISKFSGCNTISMGSSLKFMLVAEGKAQIYPRFAPTMEWDTAAAQAIVEAAGGSVLNYPSLTKLKYNRENMLNNWFICK
jgi:3'(2'), 5'-bisphosphate nucleotidase